jgi:hypothetical protein
MSKNQFKNEYNALVNQGINEIYVKMILAEKYKEIINIGDIIDELSEENDNLYNAIIEGGFQPFHMTENNISPLNIEDEQENEEETDSKTETKTECKTEH